MLQAVETVQPALADFYNSLSDDQKARFNAMGKQLFAAEPESGIVVRIARRAIRNGASCLSSLRSINADL